MLFQAVVPSGCLCVAGRTRRGSPRALALQEPCVFDTSEADAKAAVAAAAAAAAERAAPPKLLERLLSGCVIGAGWDEDESMHGVHGGRLYWDACAEPAREDSHAGFAESTGSAVLGDTLAQARARGGPRGDALVGAGSTCLRSWRTLQ